MRKNEIRPPIILYEKDSKDISLHETVSDLISSVELIDVKNNEYEVYDADGYVLDFVIINHKITSIDHHKNFSEPADLRARVYAYLQSCNNAKRTSLFTDGLSINSDLQSMIQSIRNQTKKTLEKGWLKRGLTIAAFVAVLDQLSKWWMLSGLDLLTQAPIQVLPFFDLVAVWNRGISFGMFSRHPEDLRWVLIALAVAVSAWLVHWLRNEKNRFVASSLGLIIGGALANVVDRVRFGAVFDFLDFHIGSWHYPAFNVADSAIVIGVLCLLLDGFKRSPR